MIRYLGWVLVLLASCGNPRPERPNVLFIMVDDLRNELGCYGRQEIVSPHIDAPHATALVEFVDIYPTLSELCRLDPPSHLEGRSLVPLMKDPDQNIKDAIFLRYLTGNTVKTRKYAYSEWIDQEQNSRGNMLYDHDKDPEENVNISGKPENENRIREFRTLLFNTWPELKKNP